MYKKVILTGALLTLCACSEQGKESAPAQPSVYHCDNQKTATLTNQDHENAILEFEKKTYQLKLQTSASGAKYTNENILFWSKGKEAMLILGGKKMQCNTD